MRTDPRTCVVGAPELGSAVGDGLGLADGTSVGNRDGAIDGVSEGLVVDGAPVGAAVGDAVGAAVGLKGAAGEPMFGTTSYRTIRPSALLKRTMLCVPVGLNESSAYGSLDVCMWVYVCLWLHLCMYVRMYVCMYVCM